MNTNREIGIMIGLALLAAAAFVFVGVSLIDDTIELGAEILKDCGSFSKCLGEGLSEINKDFNEGLDKGKK